VVTVQLLSSVLTEVQVSLTVPAATVEPPGRLLAGLSPICRAVRFRGCPTTPVWRRRVFREARVSAPLPVHHPSPVRQPEHPYDEWSGGLYRFAPAGVPRVFLLGVASRRS